MRQPARPEPLAGRRIAWIEDAGCEGRVRAVEAEVAARPEDILCGALDIVPGGTGWSGSLSGLTTKGGQESPGLLNAAL